MSQNQTISSRPSLDQVTAMLQFMEQYPLLALGKLKGVEGRSMCKKLWFQLSKTLNNISGPTRHMKAWMKFWSDKKCHIKLKVQAAGNDPSCLLSNIERKIWDLFLAQTVQQKISNPKKRKKAIKDETLFLEEPADLLVEQFGVPDEVAVDHLSELGFMPPPDAESPGEREIKLMDKIVNAMSEQSRALAQIAQASLMNSQAMERMAEAAQTQAQALERLVSRLEGVPEATSELQNAVADIDAAMKTYFSTNV